MPTSPPILENRHAGRLAALLVLGLLLAPASSLAQPRLAFLGLRARAGTCSDWLLGQANGLLEGRAASVPGFRHLPQQQVVQHLGSSLALLSCEEDGCMALFGASAGAERVVWAYLDPASRPLGYRIVLRHLAATSGQLLAERVTGCSPCDEATLLATLAAADPEALAFQTEPRAAAAPPAAAPLPPARVLQIPGVHRPLTPAEEARAGVLTVVSDPPGATLSLFSYPVGPTPLAGLRLLPGAYAGQLTQAGFQDLPLTLQIFPGRETRQAFRLVPGLLPLRITSQPPGAQVLLDGQPLGPTPVDGPLLPAGEHQLQVTLPGFAPVQRPVQGVPGQPVAIALTLQPLTQASGWLTVQTKPGRASVLVDGEPLGQSPLRRHRLPAGPHTVSAYLPGFAQTEVPVEVLPEAEVTATLTLPVARETRSLVTVRSLPAGARLTIDGLPAGTTPVEGIRFKPGRHVLRLTRDGYAPYELPFELPEGGSFEHDADLLQGPPQQDGLIGAP